MTKTKFITQNRRGQQQYFLSLVRFIISLIWHNFTSHYKVYMLLLHCITLTHVDVLHVILKYNQILLKNFT